MIQICSSAGILYDPRLFGVGSDCAVAEATLEQALNAAGQLKLEFVPEHSRTGLLQIRSAECWVRLDDEEIFRGRPVETTRNLYGNVTVVCEGLLAYLEDEYMRPYTAADYGSTTAGFLALCCDSYNNGREGLIPFAVDAESRDAECRIASEDYETIGEAVRRMLETCGGYLFVKRAVQNGAPVNLILYRETSGPYGMQIIEMGSNMTELSEKVNAEAIYTRVIPLGKDLGEGAGRLTIASVNEGIDWLDARKQDGTRNAELIGRFGVITKTIDLSEYETAAELLAAGIREAKKCGGENVSIELSARDLHEMGEPVGPLRLGQIHRIRHRGLGLDHWYPIAKMRLSLTRGGEGVYTFGASYTSMTARQASDSRTAGQAAAQTQRNAATVETVAGRTDVDYVVENGTNAAGWKWRKWSSGRLDMWAGRLSTSLGSWGAYTTGWEVATMTVSLPALLFDSDYEASVNISRGTGGYTSLLGAARITGTSEIACIVVKPTEKTIPSLLVDVFINGRWK